MDEPADLNVTRGEWKGEFVSEIDSTSIITIDERGLRLKDIADIWGMGGQSFPSLDEAQANLKLILASKQLYIACVAALAVRETQYDEYASVVRDARPFTDLVLLREAVNAAKEGKS